MATEIPPPIPDPLPPWARLSHTISTPRLILRTALVSDATAFTKLFSDPINKYVLVSCCELADVILYEEQFLTLITQPLRWSGGTV
jgi:hypothetical protein